MNCLAAHVVNSCARILMATHSELLIQMQAARKAHPGMDSPEGVAFRERLLAAAGAFLRVHAPAVRAQLCQVRYCISKAFSHHVCVHGTGGSGRFPTND